MKCAAKPMLTMLSSQLCRLCCLRGVVCPEKGPNVRHLKRFLTAILKQTWIKASPLYLSLMVSISPILRKTTLHWTTTHWWGPCSSFRGLTAVIPVAFWRANDRANEESDPQKSLGRFSKYVTTSVLWLRDQRGKTNIKVYFHIYTAWWAKLAPTKF